jgi:hypothetical protein
VASLLLGRTQQFTATVSGTTNTTVTWSVSGSGCSGTACGTIDSNGLYTAPNILPNPPQVTIRATSAASPGAFATASVTITSDIAISVNPSSASVELGAVQNFTAPITSAGAPSTAVTWTIGPAPGSNCSGPGTGAGQCGTIDASGLYTAPSILPGVSPPSNPEVLITATSVADPSRSASATINLTANFTFTILGPASVNNATTAQFTAPLTPVPGSNPSPAMNWSVGPSPSASCTAPGTVGTEVCGTIDATGLYTAPNLAPSVPSVRITATSVADPSKSQSLDVTINALILVTLSPGTATVELEGTQQFTANVGGTSNTAVVFDVNGIPSGNSTVGTILNSGLYTAPVNIPPGGPSVTITATSQADPSKRASATVTLTSTIVVRVEFTDETGAQLLGTSAVRAVNRRHRMRVSVSKSSGLPLSNPVVLWRVNQVAGGDSQLGQTCIHAADGTPCASKLTSDPSIADTDLDYLAPATVPSPATVTIEAVSQADPSRIGSAQVTIAPAVSVSISPPSATVPPGQVQTVRATVVGTNDQRVSWTVNGVPNGDATVGEICAPGTNPCGLLTGPFAGAVEYRAPLATPAQNPVAIRAISADDPNQSATASFDVRSGPNIRTMVPASITAGPVSPFLLRVIGTGFVVANPPTIPQGSTILVDGSPLSTSCTQSGITVECTATLDPTLPNSKLQVPGSVSVQVVNPDNSRSNQSDLLVLPESVTEALISLTAPPGHVAANQDITVVEPIFAGQGPDQQINIREIGIVSGNSCAPGNSTLTLSRPAPGSPDLLVDICVFGGATNPLLPSFTYTISGPLPNDVQLLNVQSFPLLSGVVQFTLRISSTTKPGARTLFVTTPNKDRSALTGAIEIQ